MDSHCGAVDLDGQTAWGVEDILPYPVYLVMREKRKMDDLLDVKSVGDVKAY